MVPGNVGQALAGPVVPTRGAAPVDQNQVNLWQRFQQKLTEDPNLRMALLNTGLNLLRSPSPGQSGFDVFADAASTGVSTLDQLRQRDQQQELLQRREQREETRVEQGQQRIDNDQAFRTETSARNESQFEQRMTQAQNELAERKRQFDTRNAAGDFAPAEGATTGAERQRDLVVNALMTAQPEVYPNTDEGKAKAVLAAEGFSGLDNPQGQMRMAISLYQDLMEANQNARLFDESVQALDPEEAQRQAFTMVDSFRQAFVGGEEETPQAAPVDTNPATQFEGQIIRGSFGEGVLKAVGNGYVVEYPDGNVSSNLTVEQVQQILSSQ